LNGSIVRALVVAVEGCEKSLLAPGWLAVVAAKATGAGSSWASPALAAVKGVELSAFPMRTAD
jgi:hypothetical protein